MRRNSEIGTSSRILDKVRDAIRRLKHYSLRTEEAYVLWINGYLRFHNLRHPQDLREDEIRQFLTHLAVAETVAASTQNQAFAVLLFLYRNVLNIEIKNLDALRAKKPKQLPVVFTREEARRILAHMNDVSLIVANLLYGSGLRLSEALRLRVKNVDFQMNQIIVRGGKGEKERIIMLPATQHPKTRFLPFLSA